MKLGYVAFDHAAALATARADGFDCLELVTLPPVHNGPDLVAALDSAGKISEFRGSIAGSGVGVGSLNTLLNPLSAVLARAEGDLEYLKKLIVLAGKLGAPIVSTSSGQNVKLSLDENVRLFGQVYRELVKLAEDNDVSIVFENCLHGYPAGHNIAVNPETWERIFNEVDSDSLGLEFDPSHLVFQFIDPVAAASEFVSKIKIAHAKDTEIMYDRLERGGIHSLEGYWRFRIPGYGEVDWVGLFHVLREAGFDGNVVIEHEDPVFEGDRFHEGLMLGQRFLRQFVF